MGLFSKKEVVCDRCGKTFMVRRVYEENFCPECEEIQREEAVAKVMEVRQEQGYERYRSEILDDVNFECSEENKKFVKQHRQELIDKYKDNSSPLKVDLYVCFSKEVTLLNSYPRTIIDNKDVFAAVDMGTFPHLRDIPNEWIEHLIATHRVLVFTKDPLIPFFLMPVYISGEIKEKEKPEFIYKILKDIYPNLEYPILTEGQFKKKIKKEGSILEDINEKKLRDILLIISVDDGNYSTLNTYINYNSYANDSLNYFFERGFDVIKPEIFQLPRQGWYE